MSLPKMPVPPREEYGKVELEKRRFSYRAAAEFECDCAMIDVLLSLEAMLRMTWSRYERLKTPWFFVTSSDANLAYTFCLDQVQYAERLFSKENLAICQIVLKQNKENRKRL